MRRRRFMLAAGGVALAGILPVVLRPRPAFAGEVADYPEFPYSATGYTEAYRGQFHFSPRAGWMNDPNGLLWYRGSYHFFFQHNPHGLAWDTMHWGHATSTDLVHWTPKPIALEPGVHPGDLWSGAGVVDTANTSGLKTGDDDPIVVFTGTGGVAVCYSTDGARTFQSYAAGRKVVAPGGTSRDPKVRWDADRGRWVMVVWSDAGGNGIDVHTSADLLTWTFRSRYAAGWLFECPDFFPLAGSWVLADASGEYVAGTFDGTTFRSTWTTPARMDQGRGDAFLVSAATAGDVAYEGDLTVVNGAAAALTVRAAADASGHYTANIDTGGLVKLWRPGRDLGVFPVPIVEGRTYHLKVVATGSRLQVYFQRGATPVIDVTDGTYASGRLGVNVFRGSGVVQNLVRG